MSRFILLFALLFSTFSTMIVNGQIDSLLSLSGSFDVYFRQNINSTNDASNGGTLSPKTSFANLPGFAMGMANLKAGYTKEKVSVTTDFVFGPRGKDAVFNSPAPLNIINQLFVSYAFSDKFSLTAGKFNTFVGYEVISPVGNTHYSTSYLFSYGPFNHTGIKGTYTLGKGFAATLAFMNPTDYTDFNPTNDYVEGVQLSYVKDKHSLYLNTLISKDFYQVDLTAVHKLSSKYSFGYNISQAKNAFQGVALYNTYAISKYVDLAARVEYFEDKGINILEGTNASVTDLTLSLGIKRDNFRLIPEVRFDLFKSDEKLQPILTDALQKSTSDKLSSFVLAAIANF